MAVVVSKKTAKSAVTRNRIRRRLFEAVRKDGRLNDVPVAIVCVVKDASLADAPALEIASAVSQAIDKILAKQG